MTLQDTCVAIRHELVTKLERAAFRVVRITSFVSLLLPVVAASRLVRRGAVAELYDPRTEFSLPHAVDRLFEKVMWIERKMIERRVRFPVGSSLLVVATRA
jgi:hypothetical protein